MKSLLTALALIILLPTIGLGATHWDFSTTHTMNATSGILCLSGPYSWYNHGDEAIIAVEEIPGALPVGHQYELNSCTGSTSYTLLNEGTGLYYDYCYDHGLTSLLDLSYGPASTALSGHTNYTPKRTIFRFVPGTTPYMSVYEPITDATAYIGTNIDIPGSITADAGTITGYSIQAGTEPHDWSPDDGYIIGKYVLADDDIHSHDTMYGQLGVVSGAGGHNHSGDGSIWLHNDGAVGTVESRFYTDSAGLHFQNSHPSATGHGSVASSFFFDNALLATGDIYTSGSLRGSGSTLTSAGGAGTGLVVVSTGAANYSSIDYKTTYGGTGFQTGLYGPSHAKANEAFFYQPIAAPIKFYINGAEQFAVNAAGGVTSPNLLTCSKAATGWTDYGLLVSSSAATYRAQIKIDGVGGGGMLWYTNGSQIYNQTCDASTMQYYCVSSSKYSAKMNSNGVALYPRACVGTETVASSGDALQVTGAGTFSTNCTAEGTVQAGDATNKVTADETNAIRLAGTATVFDDLVVPALSVKLPGSGEPGFSALQGGVMTYWFDKDSTESVYLQIQMPHNWKEGSTIYPHLHWTPAADSDGNPANQKVVWGLEYTACSPGGGFAATTYTDGYTHAPADGDVQQYTHYVTPIPDAGISMTGSTISTIIMCKLSRSAPDTLDDYENDAGFLSFDVHYEIDSLGSNTVSTKD